MVNRFGLETENAGTVVVYLNMCLQDGVKRYFNRREHDLAKAALMIETKKQVMHYKLQIK